MSQPRRRRVDATSLVLTTCLALLLAMLWAGLCVFAWLVWVALR